MTCVTPATCGPAPGGLTPSRPRRSSPAAARPASPAATTTPITPLFTPAPGRQQPPAAGLAYPPSSPSSSACSSQARFAIGTLIGKDDRSTKPLPAVASRPINPRQGQTRTGAIYAKAVPAVVSIRTSAGSGTGFLIDDTRTIVTNAHVVDTAKHVTVRFGASGTDLDGQVLGIDASSDLAVVTHRPAARRRPRKPLPLADSRSVAGRRHGRSRSATRSASTARRPRASSPASGRRIQAPNGFEIDQAIQTDAPINPGNSGGPLLDDSGRVIGVNSQIETGGARSGNVGIGFAVPSNTVRQIVPVLEQGKSVEHAVPRRRERPTSPSSGAPAPRSRRSRRAAPPRPRGLQRRRHHRAIDGKRDPTRSTSRRSIVDGHKVGDEIDVAGRPRRRRRARSHVKLAHAARKDAAP